MKTINNSAGKPNYSQRLNPNDPSTPWNETLETCNVTAAITAMVTAGYDVEKLSKGLAPRPPMDLLYFMRSDTECVKLYNKIDPSKSHPMNEWMDVLALAIGRYIGLQAPLRVQYAAPMPELLLAIIRGDGIVIHGDYRFKWASGKVTTGGHYQSLAGMKFRIMKEDMEVGGVMFENIAAVAKLLEARIGYYVEPVEFIVDDPFGNSHKEYVETAGNDIVYGAHYFIANVKPLNATGKDMIVIPKAV
jgi:hypothetical protein